MTIPSNIFIRVPISKHVKQMHSFFKNQYLFAIFIFNYFKKKFLLLIKLKYKFKVEKIKKIYTIFLFYLFGFFKYNFWKLKKSFFNNKVTLVNAEGNNYI